MSKIDGGLHGLFKEHFPRYHWQRIESGLTGGGIPDANYCYRRIEGWIEYKQTRTKKVTFQPDQVGWHMRRSRAGGRTFIAVRYWPAGLDSLYVYRGEKAKEVARLGLSVAPSIECSGGPSRWNWDAIEILILGKST